MFKYVVIGGGTAGWMTALFLQKKVPYADVTVVASSEIGILGAGEGVTPHFMELMNELDVSLEGLIDNAKATYKRGIKFTNWHGDGQSYYHPFWNDKFAVHFDASMLAKYFQSIATERGVKHIDDTVININSKDNGDINSFDLKSGLNLEADFVFDCSGLHRLIIGKHFNAQWNSYDDILPCNRALPFFIQHDDKDLPDYTESIAMKYGWVWRIPVQGRYGCGYVFDKRFVSDEDAIAEVKEMFGDVTVPRVFDFKAGAFDTPWINNCVAIGLSAGFTEPLEATSIWMQVTSLQQFLLQYVDYVKGKRTCVDFYNKYVRSVNNEMKNFIHMHYLTTRKDSLFWESFADTNKSPSIIDSVRQIHKKDTLQNYHLQYLRKINGDMENSPAYFDIASWNTILNGIRNG